MCTCAQKHLLPHAYPPTNSHTHARMHAYMHTRTNTHTHIHTTHLGAVPHCVGGTPQQVGEGTSVLGERVGEEPISVEGELSQEEGDNQ